MALSGPVIYVYPNYYRIFSDFILSSAKAFENRCLVSSALHFVNRRASTRLMDFKRRL
jgi:hypothetical protein